MPRIPLIDKDGEVRELTASDMNVSSRCAKQTRNWLHYCVADVAARQWQSRSANGRSASTQP
jgi:hypothetical protein